MKYIKSYKLYETEQYHISQMMDTWNKCNNAIEGLRQYFVRYWHMKERHCTPKPDKILTKEEEKEIGLYNPFKYYYDTGETSLILKLETDNDYLTYEYKCRIEVKPANYAKPYYQKFEVIIDLDIDDNVKGNDGPITNRLEQRQFLLLQLLTMERFDISLPHPINIGITGFIDKLQKEGYKVKLRLCPGSSKASLNIIAAGNSLAAITNHFFNTLKIEDYTPTCYRLVSFFIYYNDDETIMKWWNKVSHSMIATRIVQVVSKDRTVWARFNKLIDGSTNAKKMADSGFVD